MNTPAEWKETTLGDLVARGEYEIRNNLRMPLSGAEREKMHGEYPYYGAASAIDSINDYRFDGLHLLIAEDGTVTSDSKSPMLQLASGKFWVSNHSHVLRGKDERATRRLYYFLRGVDINPYITGAVQPKLSKENLFRVSFPYPSTEQEKQGVVDVLSSLDDKIELLRRQNETLEQIAQAIFNEWFVKPTADGALPDGWRMGTLGEEFQITMGQSPKGETFNESGDGILFFQGRTDFQTRFPKVRLYTTEPVRIAEPMDVLVSVRAPVGDINVALERCCIGRGLAAIRNSAKSYMLYKIRSMQSEIRAFDAEGTVFGSVSKTDLANIPVAIPPAALVVEFEKIASPIDQKILNGSRQIDTLAAVRDALLPRLMGGEIRV